MVGKHGLLVLSGGQDSVTLLAWMVRSFQKVSTITFTYGQKHSVETKYAMQAVARVKEDDETSRFYTSAVVDLSNIFKLVKSALVGTAGDDVNAKHPDHPQLPASFVPNRNALFLTIAHSFAQTIRADTIVGGMNQTDYSGYPDCRSGFLQPFMESLNKGSDSQIIGYFPLLNMTKADTWMLAGRVDAVDFVRMNSITCYNGIEKWNDWGYGCGACPACKIREKGWLEYQQKIKPMGIGEK